jgi:hypothetical protein
MGMMRDNGLLKLSRYSYELWAPLLRFDSWQGQDIFLVPQCSDWLWGPASLLDNRYCFFFLGGKLPEREADHSPPSTAQVKNDGAIPPFHRTSSWHDAQLVKHSDNFTFKKTVQ